LSYCAIPECRRQCSKIAGQFRVVHSPNFPPMPIEFECPSCRSRIRTPDEAAGKKARCPNCQQISPVPLNSSGAPLGNLGNSTTPLPSTQSPVWSPANNPPGPPTAPQQPKPNPFLNPNQAGSQTPGPVAWLPPADAFAPVGSQPTYSPPPNTNPFGDQASPYSGGPLNPYQSPSAALAGAHYPLSPEEIRQKLLGPAIGMTLGALLCIGIVLLFTIMIWLDAGFHEDIKGADEAETIGAYMAFAFFVIAGIVPSLASLFGCWSMYTGRGLVSAWMGTITGVLPCNPCFFVTAGFAIWGMVVLSDPRVSAGMK
jgi:hypothetical protein